MIAQSPAYVSFMPFLNHGIRSDETLWSNGIAFDPRNEASSFSVANMNVADTTRLQEPLHGGFNLICGRPFAGDNPAVFAVSFQRQRQWFQFFRELICF